MHTLAVFSWVHFEAVIQQQVGLPFRIVPLTYKHTHMHACMHARIHTHTHTHTHARAHTHTHNYSNRCTNLLNTSNAREAVGGTSQGVGFAVDGQYPIVKTRTARSTPCMSACEEQGQRHE